MFHKFLFSVFGTIKKQIVEKNGFISWTQLREVTLFHYAVNAGGEADNGVVGDFPDDVASLDFPDDGEADDEGGEADDEDFPDDEGDWGCAVVGSGGCAVVGSGGCVRVACYCPEAVPIGLLEGTIC